MDVNADQIWLKVLSYIERGQPPSMVMGSITILEDLGLLSETRAFRLKELAQSDKMIRRAHARKLIRGYEAEHPKAPVTKVARTP